MNSGVQSIAGVPVTTRLAMKMEDSLQAFAVRAACFIGELFNIHRTRAKHTEGFGAPAHVSVFHSLYGGFGNQTAHNAARFIKRLTSRLA